MPESYLEWNDALASRIFRPEMAGRQVFLVINKDLIDEIGGKESVRDFVAAVESGPPWVPPHMGLCQKALHAFDGWRQRQLVFPPYIGYLGLFVLAVGTDGPFARHAYYPRLRKLLGWSEVEGGAPPSFDRMLQLWEDLEVWSNRDRDGAIGVFSIRITGEWIHVGLPKAQAVLTEQERRALIEIFAAASFDPTAEPSDAVLIRALRRHGLRTLRAQTLALLAEPGSEPEMLAVLLDIVRGELQDWEGQPPDTEGDQESITNAMARVCLRLDEIASRATTSLRVASRADFPPDGLRLELEGKQSDYSCVEYLPGWSSPLRDMSTGRDVDASQFDWSEQAVLSDASEGWRVRLPGSRVRIFVSGLPFDLPGYVEVHRLFRNKPFLLAASTPTLPALAAWSESGEIDLRELKLTAGLPAGWKLYRSAGAHSDQSIRSRLPELALPTNIRILLIAGIRSGQGNTFFRFAPPRVFIEGGGGEEIVLCDGQRLKAMEDSSIFRLPPTLRPDRRISVEVHAKGEALQRQSLFLSDEFDWNSKVPEARIDQFGLVSASMDRPPAEPSNVVSGAFGEAGSGDPFPIRAIPPKIRHIQVFSIGRRTGEISQLPSQPGWSPVWFVVLGQRGRAAYCGLDLGNASPIEERIGEPEEIALWKEILWHRRKRIEPPEHPILRRLWIKYVDLAAHV